MEPAANDVTWRPANTPDATSSVGTQLAQFASPLAWP